MLFGLFGNKKPNPPSKAPSFSSKDFFCSDNSRIKGDMEAHTFYPPMASIEYSFYLTSDSFNLKPSDLTINSVDILNEKVIGELAAKYPLKEGETLKEEQKEAAEQDEISPTNVKLIRKSLGLIMRYNNDRKKEEKQGFASTLSDRAEEIGAHNTIKFLLKVIDKELVMFCITVSRKM
eukprot:TRINITY_DN399_c0_g1_i3.p1 TRINITY_DN399_c0_g1~~TRINITY_DN399_c0_g1_i3.p1  ORF type:complete len:178 (-),score=33.99 TRINITY_DN399_c0_g1_i3:579-1112(-)